MNFLLKLVFLALTIDNLSFAIRVVKTPSLTAFPIENSTFEVTCFVYDSDKLEDVKFLDRNNNNIKNSTDGNRRFTKVIEGFNQTLKLEWKKLRLNDKEVSQLICHVGETGYQYKIIIIPASNEPSVTLSPKNRTSINKEESVTLSCNAVLTLGGGWTFALEWVFNGKVLKSDGEKHNIVKILDKPGNKSSTLTINKLNNKDNGKYTCQANININNHQTESRFSESVDISVIWENTDAPAKQEIIRQDKERVEMVCEIEGYPVPTFRWQKGDEYISASTDGRYSFGNVSRSGIANSSFAISKVTYKDRSKYYCVAMFPSGKPVTQEFILRVRDPLGALWPTIGILIEAVLLFLIIALYSCCKKSRNQSSTDKVDGPEIQGETSPLVKDTPRMSYTSGEDGVRARLTTTENA